MMIPMSESAVSPGLLQAEYKVLEFGRPRFVAGYWQGLGQPAVLFDLLIGSKSVSEAVLSRFDEVVAALDLAKARDVSPLLLTPAMSEHSLLGRVVRLALQLLAQMGMPVMGGAAAMRVAPGGRVGDQWTVGLPAINSSNRAPVVALSFAIDLLNQLARGANVQVAQVNGQVQKMRLMFSGSAPAGINTLRFLYAAHKRQIPWRHVVHNVYQFGWASRSRWLDSSFTDRTSRIGTTLARDKYACVGVLRDQGLPVPAHYLVGSADLAQKAASALGYPVVVKAADLDGGVGVFAGLRTPMAVQRAYAEVVKLSKQVLVEQFIQGQDYRLQVFQGEVFWVALRRPACVCGDGQASVADLVRRENARRSQSVVDADADVMREWGGKPISLDEEATEWLAAQGLTLSSVPPMGCVVRLRGAANVTQGGTREGVPLDVVHPDNLALAVRAVAALRLDLAGVDLLVPDISRSWKKTGGAICEVNAQPQLSGHLQNLLLGQLLQGQGRVPVLCLCLPPGAWDERAAVEQALAHFELRLAWVDGANACLQVLRDPSVDAVIWSLKEPEAPLASMPVDVLDTLVVEHRPGAANEAHTHQGGSVCWMGLRARQIWRVGEPTEGASLSWASLADALVQYLTTSSAVPCVR